MTVIVPENKVENTLQQEKVDTNVSQQKSDTNLIKQTRENKPTDATQEDPNWRAFREARKKDRAEKEAAEKRAAEKEAEVAALKAAMEAAFKASTPPAQQQYYPEQGQYQHEETEDERIEKKVQAAIAIREAAAEKARIEREHQEYPTKLTKAFPDFHQTISQDNLDYLDYHYPEVSRPLQRLQDGFDKWSDIYQAIKKFVPNNTNSKKEAAKADANFSKPKSISSTGVTQPGEAVTSARLTEEKRAANWERMQKILKGVS
jgi:hypothetical protein